MTIDPSRLVEPTHAAGGLTDEQIASWRTRGFTLVDGLLPTELISGVRSEAERRFPAPGTPQAEATSDFGSDFVFPSPCPGFNAVTLHPGITGAVSQLLGVSVSELRLTQSDLWPKYGRPVASAGHLDNQDQRIHVDYPNHTLAHPAPWHRPEAVEMIVYYSDIDDCGGPTAVVPRAGDDDPAYPWPVVDTPGVGELRYVNDREAAERYMEEQRPGIGRWRQTLYNREVYARFRPGVVLFYRHDTWHRGTPMKPDTMRLAQNVTYRRADCEWVSTLHQGWAWSMYRNSKFMERLVAEASLDQRAVLGFPQPGSDYWCQETIDAVEARYGGFGMDMAPYRAAVS